MLFHTVQYVAVLLGLLVDPLEHEGGKALCNKLLSVLSHNRHAIVSRLGMCAV